MSVTHTLPHGQLVMTTGATRTPTRAAPHAPLVPRVLPQEASPQKVVPDAVVLMGVEDTKGGHQGSVSGQSLDQVALLASLP